MANSFYFFKGKIKHEKTAERYIVITFNIESENKKITDNLGNEHGILLNNINKRNNMTLNNNIYMFLKEKNERSFLMLDDISNKTSENDSTCFLATSVPQNSRGWSKIVLLEAKDEISSMGSHKKNKFIKETEDFEVSCDSLKNTIGEFVKECDKQFYISANVSDVMNKTFSKVYLNNIVNLVEKSEKDCVDFTGKRFPYYFSLMETVYIENDEGRDKINVVGAPIVRYIDPMLQNNKIDLSSIFIENDWKAAVKKDMLMILVRAFKNGCISRFKSVNGPNKNKEMNLTFETSKDCKYGEWGIWQPCTSECIRCRKRNCTEGISVGSSCDPKAMIESMPCTDNCEKKSEVINWLYLNLKKLKWWSLLLISLATIVFIGVIVYFNRCCKKKDNYMYDDLAAISARYYY